MALWESLRDTAHSVQDLWIVKGDFIMIISDKDKLGGLPVTIVETDDFKHYINLCNLEDLGFKGTKYT